MKSKEDIVEKIRSLIKDFRQEIKFLGDKGIKHSIDKVGRLIEIRKNKERIEVLLDLLRWIKK